MNYIISFIYLAKAIVFQKLPNNHGCAAAIKAATQMSVKWMDKYVQKLLNRFCKAYYDDLKYSNFGDDNENDIWQ